MEHHHLPHLDMEGNYQFITFRTQESLDVYLKKLYGLSVKEKIKHYMIDDYLDHFSRKDHRLL